MWRKNQEPQTPAPTAVPFKTDKDKAEKTKLEPKETVAASAAATSIAPEIVTPVSAVAESPAPIAAAPVPAPSAVPSFSPASTPAPAPSALPANVDSRIGSGLKIRGEISGSSDMYIDGDVQGKLIIGAGSLTIGPNGRVQADIEAREIIVNGNVVGNLKAADRVQLGSSGSVQGGVITPRIGIDDGARLRGHVETARAGETPGAGTTTATTTAKTELRAMAARGKGE